MKKRKNNIGVYQYKKVLCRDGNLTSKENCIFRQKHIPDLFGCKNCDRKVLNKNEKKTI